MAKVKKIKLPIFGTSLYLMMGDNWDDLVTTYYDEIEDGEDIPDEMEQDFINNKAFAAIHTSNGFSQLFFVANSIDEISAGTIAHEAYHLMNYLFRIIGYRHDLENDELAAYTLNYLVDTLTAFVHGD